MVRKRQVALGSGLLLVYFFTRLTLLTKLPIFTDEAIYIRWGQIGLQDAAHRFISLEDGKQPLFIWLMLPMLHLIGDPLLAGRLVSVTAGLVTLVGMVILSGRLFGERIGWLVGWLYLITPFFVLYDRMALYDSLTTAIMVWSLLLAVWLVRSLRLDAALLLGMTIGAGFLTKSSVLFALILLPATLLLFNFKSKGRKKELVRWLGLVVVVGLLSLLFQTILRLSPLYHMVGLKNLTFVISLKEFLAEPFARFSGNIRGLTDWAVAYLTPSLVIALIIGVISGMKRAWRKTILLGLWFAVPFTALATFGRVLYPRFLLFMLAPLLPLIALGVNYLTRYLNLIKKSTSLFVYWSICLLVYLSIGLYPVYFSSLIVFRPIDAPLPLVDRNQFMDDWPSGYGIPEVINLLQEEARLEQIFVGTEGTFGLTPTALEIYLQDNQNIKIKGYWPIADGIPELIEISKTGLPTYVLFKDTQEPKPEWPVEEVVRYRKGKGDVYMSLYRVAPR